GRSGENGARAHGGAHGEIDDLGTAVGDRTEVVVGGDADASEEQVDRRGRGPIGGLAGTRGTGVDVEVNAVEIEGDGDVPGTAVDDRRRRGQRGGEEKRNGGSDVHVKRAARRWFNRAEGCGSGGSAPFCRSRRRDKAPT